MPDSISKLWPSKVINWGTALYINNQNKIISTGILTICRMVKVLISILSKYLLPLFVRNNIIIPSSGGKTNSINLGGKVSVTV